MILLKEEGTFKATWSASNASSTIKLVRLRKDIQVS